MSDLTLTAAEIEEITGFAQPCKQLETLHNQGFVRAHRTRDGRVILERAHYVAVCSGQFDKMPNNKPGVNIDIFRRKAA